jgi:hypothetical protein
MSEKTKPETPAPEEERLHPILTNEEVRKAKEKARAKIEAASRAAAMKAIEDQEVERLRVEEGMVTGAGVKDEIVNLLIELAPFADRIIFNQKVYLHARTYPVPRHVADSLREVCWRTKVHEHDTKDENLFTFYGKQKDTLLSPAGIKDRPHLPGRPA